jgi:hypothetical protein
VNTRPLKLTEKLKYLIDPGGHFAIVYAVHRASGQWRPAFTCNVSTLAVLKNEGYKAALRRGLVCLLHE